MIVVKYELQAFCALPSCIYGIEIGRFSVYQTISSQHESLQFVSLADLDARIIWKGDANEAKV